MNKSFCILLIHWIAFGSVLSTIAALADDKESEANKPEERLKASYVRAMRTMAEGLAVSRLTPDAETECPMVKEPVLNWSDSARHPDLLVPGTTWIWHQKGRPTLIGEIYGRVESVGSWNLFACNLSGDRLSLADGPIKMTFAKGYYEPKVIAGAPVVAKKKSERTVQMRDIAERFDAHQFWKERFELRLLPKPIYRYEDPESGIVDGAIYGLVHGTNPEVLLLIEAHKIDDGTARWKVGFGSLAGARCVVRLDEKEYWTCPEHAGDPDDPRQGMSKFVAVEE
jgi:hypothetical protein